VEIQRLGTEHAGHCTLVAVLRDTSYEDIFSTFAEDVVARLRRCNSSSEAAQTFVLRLERWQRFLTAARDGLSQQEQTGLFGELHFLLHQLLPRFGSAAVPCWYGPDEAAKDFIIQGIVAVEVKSTLSRAMEKVTISSEHQLDDTGFQKLYLLAMRFELLASGGVTLNEIIDTIRAELAGSSEQLAVLNAQLAEGGYHSRHRHRYEAAHYKLAAMATYRVDSGFPRLVPGNVDAAVSEVRYRLHLAHCRPYAVPDNQVFEALGENS